MKKVRKKLIKILPLIYQHHSTIKIIHKWLTIKQILINHQVGSKILRLLIIHNLEKWISERVFGLVPKTLLIHLHRTTETPETDQNNQPLIGEERSPLPSIHQSQSKICRRLRPRVHLMCLKHACNSNQIKITQIITITMLRNSLV